ncbi:MAG: ComEA family DNA-binding protein [Flavisolibacter sp.]
MNVRIILKEYFSFSRRDRTGILVLTALILIIYCLPFFFTSSKNEVLVPNDVLALAIDSFDARELNLIKRSDPEFRFKQADSENSYKPGALFRFNPNTLPFTGWQKLGLSEKTAMTIDKYRQKGGRFYQADDLQKIWGLPPGFYDRVKSYIDLPEKPQRSFAFKDRPQPETWESKLKSFDINTADSSSFIALPGIGPKLASRIIGFREKLGGFYSIEQVKETYGLPDSTFQKINPYLKLESPPRQLNLNLVSREKLRAHPYFKWNLANAIIEYRTQHGPFKNLESLKKIALIDEDLFNRIRPYLVIE